MFKTNVDIFVYRLKKKKKIRKYINLCTNIINNHIFVVSTLYYVNTLYFKLYAFYPL